MTTSKRGAIPPRSGAGERGGHRGSLDTVPASFSVRTMVALAAALGLALAASPVAADAGPASGPTPGFVLIGDVAQKLTESAPGWTDAAAYTWSWTADLKPKFTYGALTFVADTSWTLPLTGSLTAAVPTATVYEAYFRVTPVEALDLTFGQKRYNLGVGQSFTVGDTINPVIGFFDQKTGFRGATAEYSPVSWLSVSAAVTTDGSNPQAPSHAEQVSVLVDKLQLTASLSAENDRSFAPALGASYDLAGIIVTAEGAAEFLPQGRRPSGPASTWSAPTAWTQPALSASAGARYTVTLFDLDVTVAAEYLHWAQGFSADETAAWQAAGSPTAKAAALAATRGVRGQENAFFRLTVTSGTELTLATFAAVDLTDHSVLGQQTVTWSPWDNVELTAALKAAQGDTGTAWANLGAANANARYQTSFSVMYHF